MRLSSLFPLLLASSSAAQQSIASTRSWRCEFPTLATTHWQGDQPSPSLEKQTFSFHIDDVNHAKSTARVIGNVGANDLIVIQGSGVVHFLENTPSGNLIITTIFQSNTNAAKLKAVHSRHVYILTQPVPSQAYGYCEPWQ